MSESRFPAGNVTFAVNEFRSRVRDRDGLTISLMIEEAGQKVCAVRFDWFPDRPHYHYNPETQGAQRVPVDPAMVGDSIGWFEGFKARSDLFSVAGGVFLGSNPLLLDRIAVIDDDRYRRGWLYEVQGEAEPNAMDMHAYAALLDRTIARMREAQGESTE
jgi:hypothetical protein